jgi:PAS domain S-box-containing protein
MTILGRTSSAAEADTQGIKASAASETRYRRLFEAAKDGILILDARTGQVLDANPFLLELLGYSLEEIVGMRLWQIGPLKDIAASATAFAELQAKDYIRYENLPLQTKEGCRREVEFVSTAYVADGLRFMQCHIRDMTERKRKDDERRQFADVLDERSLNEVYIYDLESLRFVHVNEGARRNLGYTLEQLRAMTVLDIRPEFDRESFRIMVGPLVRNEEVLHVFQTTQRRRDGTLYPVEVHLQLMERQGVRLVLAVALDITKRQEGERALRESEERYRLLIERSPDAIFVHCADKIVFANPATLLLFGAERPEQVLGRDVLEIMHPDSRAIVQERVRHAAAGEMAPLLEQRLIRLDGSVVEVEAIGIASTHAGNPAVQVILRDVTEKKSMEAQALRSQRMESIGLLASGIAHDLNNALSPILMAAGLLQGDTPNPRDAKLLGLIEEGAHHAAVMVKQVLTFARGTEEERAHVEIGPLLEELGSIARHTFSQAIQMQTEIAPDVWPVQANYTQLHQVMLNLCINARDAMPEGGTLTLAVENLHLAAGDERLSRDVAAGPFVRLRVLDTGAGMSPEVQAHIFDPFFTTKGPGKGTGLGLSSVQAIVEGHGGLLHFQSAPGAGTEFQIYLPAALDTAGRGRAKPWEEPPPLGNGELILLVDDEAAIRSILAQTLQTCGYRVVSASDGPQAVALCARNPTSFELLITDMDMPMMSGAATIQAVRTLAPRIKVIMTSGTSSATTMTNLEGQAFLPKPYSAGDVLRLVHDVLGGTAAIETCAPLEPASPVTPVVDPCLESTFPPGRGALRSEVNL